MQPRLSPRDFARHLRTNATPEERAVWNILGRVRPRFTRQLSVHPHIADFACRRARLLVEIDGSQHADSEADCERTAGLEASRWHVVRFWNSDVRDNLDGVIEAILIAGAERLPDSETFAFVASRAGRQRQPRTRGGEEQ